MKTQSIEKKKQIRERTKAKILTGELEFDGFDAEELSRAHLQNNGFGGFEY
jgi:hypothetical protein